MKIIKIILLAAALSFAEGAQQRAHDFFAKIGFSFGGTMPLPMPANIEKIKSYSPSFIPAIEAGALRRLGEKAGVSASIGLDNKGLGNASKVKEYSMKFGEFDGKFTGNVNTEMSFHYLRLPALAHYAFSDKVSAYAGLYYAYLLKGEFKGYVSNGRLNSGVQSLLIEHKEEFDFSKDLLRSDAGLCFGANFLPLNEHIMLSLDFNYGFVSVFPSDFSGMGGAMRNVYARISAGYLF